MPLIPPQFVPQLDTAIRCELMSKATLAESVQAYAGKSVFHKRNLQERVEARLPEAVGIWAINRINQLLRSNPDHPRAKYG